MVAISRGKGVLTCERYEKMDAQYFTSFIDQHFDTMFERCGKGLTRLLLQDGDPSQNSKSACDAMACCHSEALKIPPRIPDLNPVENIFHIVSKMQLIRELHVSHIKSGLPGVPGRPHATRSWGRKLDNTKSG